MSLTLHCYLCALISRSQGLSTGISSERLSFHPHHPRNSPSSPSLPHVSRNLLAFLIPQFPVNFQQCLGGLQKRTKKDLLTHPLVVQLQTCNSSSAVLTLIHQQVQGFQRDDGRLTNWLDPTVRVLLAFSETLGERVSLVSLRK